MVAFINNAKSCFCGKETKLLLLGKRPLLGRINFGASGLSCVHTRGMKGLALWIANTLKGSSTISGKSVIFVINKVVPDYFFHLLPASEHAANATISGWEKIEYTIEDQN